MDDPGGEAPVGESVILGRLRSAFAPALLAIAAVASLQTVLRRVTGGSRFQYYDYWAILSSSVSPDGSFKWSTLLLLQNEHPVAAARLLYYANARGFSGSNRTLGMVVVGLALLQIVLVVLALRRVESPRRLLVGIVAVGAEAVEEGVERAPR